MDKAKEKQLMLTAAKARMLCVEAVHTAASGHPGGSLSVADIITYLYSEVLRVDPENPSNTVRTPCVSDKACKIYGIILRFEPAYLMPWVSIDDL